MSVDLKQHLNSPAGTAPRCCTLCATAQGTPVVGHGGLVAIIHLPDKLRNPLQKLPLAHEKKEQTVDDCVLEGMENTCIFPTLQRHYREVEVAKPYFTERDLLRRVLASAQPLYVT